MSFTLGAMPRRLQPEIMDGPDLEDEQHRRALVGLARINHWSRAAATLWRPIQSLAMRQRSALRVLDVACGGGDVVCGLARRARRAKVKIELAGCDISPRAIEFAANRARHANVSAEFFVVDALRDPLPSGFDVVVSSLFLHHLDEADADRLLAKMAQACKQMMLVNDLRRSTSGLWLARVATRLLSRSPVVHFDGPRSVENAFTAAEIAALASRAGLAGCTITRCWPQRLVLVWRKVDRLCAGMK